ncbi:hypothetical protein WMY93_016930 [Mugilogobius chulae]|uniref:BED-type domain-containing protein n=1 Tax=Mugilogobius chulae TaxID=88201 RepID=A0AAW0NPG9_9GOBI
MAERAKRSRVWLYFTKIDADNARCLKCNKTFSCKGGTTSNLSKHVAKIHGIQTERCTVFDECPPAASSSSESDATERFMEQYPAIQAAVLDPRLRKTKEQAIRLKDEDFHKAEDFIHVMKVLYTSTLCLSGENVATSGQILPILQKLEEHFTVSDEDTVFVTSIKEKVWGNLLQRY